MEGSEAGSKECRNAGMKDQRIKGVELAAWQLKALGSAVDSSIKGRVWDSEKGQRLVFWFTYFLELNTNYHLLSTVVLLVILCRISVVTLINTKDSFNNIP